MNFTGRQLTDEELEILGPQPSHGPANWIIHRNPSFFVFKKVYDRNAQVLNPETYFKDLVSRFTSGENLPRFTCEGAESKSVPLYGLDTDGRASLPKDTFSGEGLSLALEVLPEMFFYNLCVRLQQEMSLILESKTTDDTQMARVGSLLNQFGNTRPVLRETKIRRARDGLIDSSLKLAGFAADAIFHRSWGSDRTDPNVASQPREASHDLENATPPLSDREESTRSDGEEPRVVVRSHEETRKRERRYGFSTNTQFDYERSERRERLARKLGMRNRFIAAVLGGLSLIAPMLIMAIKPSQVKTLCTSSVAVLLFSLGLAWMSSARTETLLATTATYAAVMVVFVGVNSNN
ncbi:MAG: hypothetical protein Q9204_004712 [Flavoplaca sp. TL-2023a]